MLPCQRKPLLCVLLLLFCGCALGKRQLSSSQVIANVGFNPLNPADSTQRPAEDSNSRGKAGLASEEHQAHTVVNGQLAFDPSLTLFEPQSTVVGKLAFDATEVQDHLAFDATIDALAEDIIEDLVRETFQLQRDAARANEHFYNLQQTLHRASARGREAPVDRAGDPEVQDAAASALDLAIRLKLGASVSAAKAGQLVRSLESEHLTAADRLIRQQPELLEANTHLHRQQAHRVDVVGKLHDDLLQQLQQDVQVLDFSAGSESTQTGQVSKEPVDMLHDRVTVEGAGSTKGETTELSDRQADMLSEKPGAKGSSDQHESSVAGTVGFNLYDVLEMSPMDLLDDSGTQKSSEPVPVQESSGSATVMA